MKYIIRSLILGVGCGVIVVFSVNVFAQNPPAASTSTTFSVNPVEPPAVIYPEQSRGSPPNPFADVSYPIAALGNCGSREECKAFCDVSENRSACIDWAKQTQVFQVDQADRMTKREQFRRDVESLESGPGGCVTPAECDAYCRVLEHLDACLDHSVKYGYTTAEEAAKVREQAKKGGPGGCNSEESCRAYCQDPAHVDECFSSAAQEGRITTDEAQFLAEQAKRRAETGGRPPSTGPEEKIDKQKVESILAAQKGPGGCTTIQECSAFCMNPDHAEECMSFAVKNQIAPPEELERMRKLSSMTGPGGCKGPQECQAYCSAEEHMDECFDFSKRNQLMSDEEIQRVDREREIVKKMRLQGQQGPGGCATPAACNQYCQNPANVEQCVQFAAKAGILQGDTVSKMMRQTQEAKQKLMQIEREKAFFEQAWSDEANMPPSGPYGPEDRRPPFGPRLLEPKGSESGEGMPPGGTMDQYGPPPWAQQGMPPPEGMMQGGTMYGPPPGTQTYPGGTMPFSDMMNQYGPPPGATDQYGPPSDGTMYGPQPGMEMYGPPAGTQMYPGGMTPPTDMMNQYGPPPGGTMYGPPPGTDQYGPPPSSFQTPFGSFFGSILKAFQAIGIE